MLIDLCILTIDLSKVVGEERIELPDPEGTKFTVLPATNYGLLSQFARKSIHIDFLAYLSCIQNKVSKTQDLNL